jgi:hypothetical protein
LVHEGRSARWLRGAAAVALSLAAAVPAWAQGSGSPLPPEDPTPVQNVQGAPAGERPPQEPVPVPGQPPGEPVPTEPPATAAPAPDQAPPEPEAGEQPEPAEASAQEDPAAAAAEAQPEPAADAVQDSPQGEEGAEGDDQAGGEEAPAPPQGPREGFLPRLDVYFPEGDLDLRVNRLINKVFFEGQVKYNFVDGDIDAFLRYRYYGFRRVTQFTVFDSIEFRDIEDLSSDFDRVRGALILFEWPHDYNHRTFLLAEIDRIFSNIPALRFNNDTTNDYLRFGYQLGTPSDRSTAIVGETRARRERLFTAVREFGPGDAGFTGAVTYAFDYLNGDYEYVKLEAEGVKRFDVTPRTFLIGRLHGGSFLYKRDVREGPEIPIEDQFSIPRSEFFRLDGRENLKGISDRMPGLEELHTTWEYFFPWFLDASRDFLRLEWQNWYWVLYGGMGTVGFDREVYADFDSYIPDVGIGFESSFRLRRKYRFFLSGIVAQALKGDGGVEARVSVKSYR